MSAQTSLEAMDDMIRALTKFEQDQMDLATQIRQQYDRIGQDWNDKQYQNLGENVAQIITAVSSSYTVISEGITRCQILRRALEDYLNS